MWQLSTTAGLSLLLFVTPLLAADMPESLSLSDAVHAALNVNANLKEAQEEYRSSLSRLRIAGFDTQFTLGGYTDVERNESESGLSGSIFGNLRYQDLLGTEALLEVAPFGMGNRRGSMALSVRRPLTRGRGLLSGKANMVQGARIGASLQDKQLYLTAQSTVVGVVGAYYRAALALELVKVQQEAVAIAEKAADGADRRAEAGLIAGIEVSRAELRAARTRDELNLQRQAARASLDRLMLAIGSGVGQTPELTDAVPVDDLTLPDLATAVETGLANRSELAAYDLQLSDQERKLAIATDQLQPALDIVAGLNYVNDDDGVLSTSLIRKGDLAAGVEIRFPFDKRIGLEERYTAERGVDVLRNLRTYQMEQIAEQVRNAYRSVESTRASVEILNQSMEIATANLEQAQLMVELGLTSNREELDAEEALTRTQSSLLRARTDLFIAGVNLRYAMGEDLTSMGTK